MVVQNQHKPHYPRRRTTILEINLGNKNPIEQEYYYCNLGMTTCSDQLVTLPRS